MKATKIDRITNKQLEKIINIFGAKAILDKHMELKVNLTSEQLDIAIAIKNEKVENHGRPRDKNCQ